jgi:hypothetical protein
VDARDIDWRRYDRLKAQGRSGRQIAQDMGVAESTLRGALKRRQSTSSPLVQSSADQSSAVQSGAESLPTALVPTVAAAAIIDLLRQTLARLDTVEHDLKAIREDRQPGAVQSGAEPPTLTPEEARAERWNLWLPRGLRQRIEAVAKARGHAPSKVVQEALWQWLTAEDT